MFRRGSVIAQPSGWDESRFGGVARRAVAGFVRSGGVGDPVVVKLEHVVSRCHQP